MRTNFNRYLSFLFLLISLLLSGKISYSSESIKIASFNIQMFGPSKAGNDDVMEVLSSIISNYDLVAIQEIKDKTGTAIKKLENEVDANGINYDYIIGPRLGLTISKEQYAYFYRTDTIEMISSYTYGDFLDQFHREPFCAHFKVNNSETDFILVDIHTDPDEANSEVYLLPSVVDDAKKRFNDSDVIILGDFNADCSYFNESDLSVVFPANEYIKVIEDEVDTTVSATNCTYDRIFLTSSIGGLYGNNKGVFRYDIAYSLDNDFALEVSDHYPVWFELEIKKTCNDYVVPHFSSLKNYNFWTGLGLVNKNKTEENSVKVVLYGNNGELLGNSYFNIPPHGQKAFVVGQGLNAVGWLDITSHFPVSGLAFVGHDGNKPSMVDIPFVSDLAKCLIIPHVAQDDCWDTTIYLCSPAGGPIVLECYDCLGNLIGSLDCSLPENGSAVFPVVNILNGEDLQSGWVYIENSSGIAAFAIYNNLKSGGSYCAGIAAESLDNCSNDIAGANGNNIDENNDENINNDDEHFDNTPVISSVYHGNVDSKIFHKNSCRYYNCKNCTSIFYSRSAAIRAGYRPCLICKP